MCLVRTYSCTKNSLWRIHIIVFLYTFYFPCLSFYQMTIHDYCVNINAADSPNYLELLLEKLKCCDNGSIMDSITNTNPTQVSYGHIDSDGSDTTIISQRIMVHKKW